MSIAVIEVNGTGRYQGDALLRDETKRTAIECGGINYIAIREKKNAQIAPDRELEINLSEHHNSKNPKKRD